MRFLGWISNFFFIVGLIAIVCGLRNEDAWVLCLGALMWVESNFFEILINRDMIRKNSDAVVSGEEHE